MKDIDTLSDSLEKFYGSNDWGMGVSEKRTVISLNVCGAYRVPGGRVRCTLQANHGETLHRGYDAAIRLHSWS